MEKLNDKHEQALRKVHKTRKKGMISIILNFIIWVLFDFIDGRFGKYVLQDNIRMWWTRVWLLAFIVFTFWVLFLILDWWSGVVDFLNYVIWG